MALRKKVKENPKLPYASVILAASYKNIGAKTESKNTTKTDDKSNKKKEFWSADEKQKFYEAMGMYGRNFFKIKKHV